MESNVNNGLDIKLILNAVKRNFLKVLLFAVCVAIITFVIVSKMSPVYTAKATIHVESTESRALNFDPVYGADFSKREYFETQFAIIKSETLARNVIGTLSLWENEEFIISENEQSKLTFIYDLLGLPQLDASRDSQEIKMQRILKQFSDKLSVNSRRGTRLIEISFDSADPELAALVVNTITSTYQNSEISSKSEKVKEATDWLNNRLVTLRKALDESEIKLQEYLERENLIEIDGSVSLVSQNIASVSERLSKSQNEIARLRGIQSIINKYGQADILQLESIPEITSHPLIQNVKKDVIAVERKFSELTEVYGPKHPKLIAAQSELRAVRGNLEAQIKLLTSSVQKELSNEIENSEMLNQRLKSLKVEFQSTAKKETEYLQLKREVESNRKLYNAFVDRSKETTIAGDSHSSMIKVIDKAFVPTFPVKPKKKLIILASFVVSFCVGLGLIVLLAILNDTIKSSRDVENGLSQRMLGVIPLLDKNHVSDSHTFFNNDNKHFSESIRTFRTNLMLSHLDKANKLIEVTSSVPNEGKTTTSINLCFALSQMEKVVLIDADMRKPSVCRHFGIPQYHPGLANFIAGTASLEECLYLDEQSGVYIMPSGQIPPNPLELLAHNRFSELLSVLKQRFDRVVLDTAPTQAVSDSLMISKNMDIVIYVVKADDTRQQFVKRGLGRLLEVNANIAGIVLNQVDVNKTEQYGGYYDYYGYAEDKNS
ncbi:GumC family protein [Pseudoalteromonas piratica]|uniref:non-specific protein-tyrosine kinase n=1 Tax=Pseudoalteromonas piratica TaxID=1348114 RepID=A0A0A7EFK0_9GAMM|nr:polysaccharide biosynthesis tyrosine autokinase [Pseudoalteromonas piratica]AIY65440.1 hypothetical protein OM33_09980 [Pseudoalteromonas piratica]